MANNNDIEFEDFDFYSVQYDEDDNVVVLPTKKKQGSKIVSVLKIIALLVLWLVAFNIIWLIMLKVTEFVSGIFNMNSIFARIILFLFDANITWWAFMFLTIAISVLLKSKFEIKGMMICTIVLFIVEIITYVGLGNILAAILLLIAGFATEMFLYTTLKN